MVVVTHNSAHVIDRCLAAILRELPDCPIVVVDNASSDDTAERSRQAGASVVLNEANVGYGSACNQGARSAETEHLLFLNPDVLIKRVDLDRLVEVLDDGAVGLVGPHVLSGTSSSPAVFRERSLTRDVLAQALGPLRPRELPSRGRVRRPRSWWLGGSALLVRRSEFLAVGGFNEAIFLYSEDRDLTRRYRREGLPVTATRAIELVHQPATSTVRDAALTTTTAGWALLGWVEYLSDWQGTSRARRAARALVWMWSALERALAALAPLSTRAARKRDELRGTLAFVAEQAAAAPTACGFCPHARQLFAEALPHREMR